MNINKEFALIGKTTKFPNILSGLICGDGRRKYDRPNVNKEFHTYET